MRNIKAIFKKQLKETAKNTPVLIQFLLFPAMTLIMSRAVHIDGLSPNYFVTLFAAMFIGMAPLTSISSIIAEEKEKNTLRVLMMSNVKPWEYLLGVGTYVFLCCLTGGSVIVLSGSYNASEKGVFFSIMVLGILASLLVGAAIGGLSKNQMAASSLTVPVMMALSFLPMLSMFNDTIAKFGKFLYTVQIQNMIQNIGTLSPEFSGIAIIAGNILAATGLFIFAYRKSKLA